MHGTDPSAMLETTISHWIRVVGNGIEVFGILVIVIGIVWSTMRYLRRLSAEQGYDISRSASAARCCSGSRCWLRPISSRRSHLN